MGESIGGVFSYSRSRGVLAAGLSLKLFLRMQATRLGKGLFPGVEKRKVGKNGERKKANRFPCTDEIVPSLTKMSTTEMNSTQKLEAAMKKGKFSIPDAVGRKLLDGGLSIAIDPNLVKNAPPAKRDVGGSFAVTVGASPCVITQPGRYVFHQQQTYNPPVDSPNKYAVVVLSSDVVIDLKGWTLKLSASAIGQAGATYGGILVDGVNNVVIKNGTVRDFLTTGVLIRNTVTCGTVDVSLQNNGPIGGAALPNGSIVSGGLVAVASRNLRVIRNVVNGNAGFGLGFAGCTNIYTTKSNLDANRDMEFPGGRSLYAFGAFVTSAPFDQADNTIVVTKTTANNNRARDTLYCLSIFSLGASYPPFGVQPLVQNLIVEDVQISDSQLTAQGFEGSALFCIGAILLCRNTVVRRLTVSKIGNLLPAGNAPYSIEVQGIEVGGENALCEHCVVTNVYGNSTGENMTGINSELVSNNLIFRKNTIQDVFNNSSVQRAAGINANEFVGFPGIVEAPAVSLTIERNDVQNVRTSAPAEFAGNGYNFQALQKSFIYKNLAQNNQNGFFCLDVAPGLASANNIFLKNKSICNSGYGFLDRTPTSGNVYLKNLSYGNGLGNFLGLPANDPNTEWNPSRKFPNNYGPEDNLSILLASAPRDLADEEFGEISQPQTKCCQKPSAPTCPFFGSNELPENAPAITKISIKKQVFF